MNTHKISWLLPFLLLSSALGAQDLPLSVLGAAGNELSNGAVFINYTLGEAITDQLTADRLTQGFQQGVLQRCIALNTTNPPAPAYDTLNFDPCDATVQLSHPAYPDISVQWLKDGLSICTDADCSVALEPGVNVFQVSLSAVGCPAYAVDSVVVVKGLVPEPEPDRFAIFEGLPPTVSYDLLGNDLGLDSSYTLEILAPLPEGLVVTPHPDSIGIVTISADIRKIGVDSFFYRVCNTGTCSACADGFVVVEVLKLLGEGYNDGITPNGDDKNEFFILCTPCDACEPCDLMSLWVYNRWGNLVYENADYQNDWNGVNLNGANLPAGTYFYYATIGKQERKGTITIIR